MYVVSVPNRGSPPAVLLRESYRENGKVKNRTLANLSGWPADRVEALRQLLKGKVPTGPKLEDAFRIIRTRPHGHVAAILGLIRALKLDVLLDRRPSRNRQLVLAMLVARIIAPRSKLATVRGLDPQTVDSTLGEVLGVTAATADELYEALDWLLERQKKVEHALAARHLCDGSLTLYDVSSTYFEGHTCSLAKRGYSRDGKRDKLQVVFGVLADKEGFPLAVEVFEGNTADPKTLSVQIEKLKKRFELKRIILVGDRGMITQARIRDELQGVEGLDWITALRAPAIRELAEQKLLQLSLFDKRDLAEIESPDYPGERLMACLNPLLAEERTRKRKELLVATEKELQKIVVATTRTNNPLRGKDKIGLRVGKAIGRFKMGKHFKIKIGNKSFEYEQDKESINREAALDGIYIVRTSLAKKEISTEGAVSAYKGLASIERVFRSMKTVDLHVRPIYHRKADRVRAHIFLCMLAYYVERHMRQKLKPILFDDPDPLAGQQKRDSVVAKAQRSDAALAKAATKRNADGEPVHDFQTLFRDLATLAKNRVRPTALGATEFDMITSPTPYQQRIFSLLGVSIPA